MAENHIRMLCTVIKVDLVYESPEGKLTAFFDSVPDSPLMQSAPLRQTLRAGIGRQRAPYLHKEKNGVFFAALHAENGFLYMGPMCSEKLNSVRRRQFYDGFGIDPGSARTLPSFTLVEIRNMILLTNSALKNGNLENEELLHLNQLVSHKEKDFYTEQTRFVLKEEAENDDEAYRHSYYEEQLLMQAIREGRTEDAIRLTENMDKDSGRLAGAELSHWRNLAIIGISLCTRAAIEGGLSPEEGYRLSGYYIQKCDLSHDPAHVLHHRNRAIEELTVRVRSAAEKPRGSGHVERCKDYVRKHYREKIYLEDVAEVLEISPTYLSRLFKKETGQCLQDYINAERVRRAADLLTYSTLSLTDIAEYVHFPNQSYFGKIFKQQKHMTPKEYRDKFASPEAAEQRP